MSQNPLEPQEKIGSRRAAFRYTLLWKGYFAFSVYAVIVSSLYVPTITSLTYVDVLDFAVSLVAVVGLYGFVYSVRIGKVVFWRYFFYLALLESLVFCLLIPLFGGSRYGREFHLEPAYPVELLYIGIMLYALNLYAYKRPALWKRARS